MPQRTRTEPLVALPEPWNQMLVEGQVLTALLLSTLYSEKYRGASMSLGDVAEIRLPTRAAGSSVGDKAVKPQPALAAAPPSAHTATSPALLAKAGAWQASVDIWLGDASVGDRTIYVAFGPLAKKRQLLTIIRNGARLMDEPVRLQNEGGESNGSKADDLQIFKHVSLLLQELWLRDDLRGKLDAAVVRNPGHRVLFSGISHGATLAQAAALQCQLAWRLQGSCDTSPEVLCVAWNGYKWTDDAGSALAKEVLGNRLLPIVMSRGKAKNFHYDAVPGFPAGLAAMPSIIFLDADDGTLLSCDGPYEDSRVLNSRNAKHMLELHFAKKIIAGTRAAMQAAIGGPDAHKDKVGPQSGHSSRRSRCTMCFESTSA